MRKRNIQKIREEARRLYLTGEMSTNAEIAARLGIKPHTAGKWRRSENWDDLRRKVDVRAGEMFIEKIASERVNLNIRHYRLWDLLLVRLAEDFKGKTSFDIRDLERIASVVDRAQKGQRLAKGLATGETEETIRAQAEAEIRRVVDTVIDAVKENVGDEDTRDRIRKAILDALPQEAGAGVGEPGDEIPH